MNATKTRQLDLDEKRFALEAEKRKNAIEEYKMLDVMQVLCKKLE